MPVIRAGSFACLSYIRRDYSRITPSRASDDGQARPAYRGTVSAYKCPGGPGTTGSGLNKHSLSITESTTVPAVNHGRQESRSHRRRACRRHRHRCIGKGAGV